MSYYVTHENSILNINNAHLKVSGNVMTDVMKLGAIEFAPPESDVPGTVNFTNVTTGVTTTSNLNVGGTLMLGSVEVVGTPANAANLHDVVELGNVTSNTVQFTNATTGIVATGNVETQGKFIGDGSLLTGITTIESNVDLIRNTDNTAFINLNSNVVTEFPRSKKLIKYPRVVLTANGLNQGYTVSGSNEYSAGLTYYGAFTPPTSSNNPSGAWLTPTSGTTGYSTGNGDYLLSAQLHSGSLLGEYVQIVLPERINPVYFTVQPRPESASNNQGLLSCIKDGEIWASNDSGTTWTLVGTIQNFTPTGLYQEYIVDNFNVHGYYDTFALIIHKNNGQTFAGVGEWKIFGVPEYDPDAHGTDVIVKSVANVPNTDWLEVYYDAKGLADNSTTVNDLKPVGTPNNGTVGGNTSVTDEAFTFDGTGDYITSTVTTGTGNQSFSVACWFKFTTLGGLLWGFTGTTNGTGGSPTNYSSPHSYFNTTGSITFDFWANATVTDEKLIEVNRWYAGVWTYDGTTRKIYIDGIQVHLPQSSTQLSIIDNTSRLSIGIYPTNLSGGPMTGSVANFRLFNRALTSDEAWQLYAYQKEYFGHGDLSMTLKAGRLGIGTSEPRAALDVRGSLNFGIPNVHSDSLSGYGSISAATEEAGYAPLGNDMYVVWGNYAIAHTGSGQYNWTWYFPNDFTMTVLSAVGTLRDCGYGYSYDRSGLGINGYYTNRIAGHTKNDTIGSFTQHIHFVVIGKKV
tara:strand:+ start:167 stop:2386 length:2220 start_codon:yes stop_codon:yes gene_type:complete